MTVQQPEFINDSVLAHSIFNLLTQKGEPVTATEIAEQVLPIHNLTPELTHQIIEVILKQDSRFHQLDQDVWTLSQHPVAHQNILELTYVVLDVEIIGSARFPHIIEIAAFRLTGLKIIADYHTFVNPGRTIIPKILKQLTGEIGTVIDSEILKHAPTITEVLPSFFQFIGRDILVAHNAAFDLRMINRELKRVGQQKLVNPTVDTLKLSRKLLPGIDSQKLPSLAYYFGISLEEHHLAKDDAFALARIFLQFLRILHDQNFEQLDQLAPFFIHF